MDLRESIFAIELKGQTLLNEHVFISVNVFEARKSTRPPYNNTANQFFLFLGLS